MLSVIMLAALKAAATEGPSGRNGFQNAAHFLDNIATYLIYLAIPIGALGIIAGGGMLIVGNSDGAATLAKTAVGVGVVLLAKGIMS